MPPCYVRNTPKALALLAGQARPNWSFITVSLVMASCVALSSDPCNRLSWRAFFPVWSQNSLSCKDIEESLLRENDSGQETIRGEYSAICEFFYKLIVNFLRCSPVAVDNPLENVKIACSLKQGCVSADPAVMMCGQRGTQ